MLRFYHNGVLDEKKTKRFALHDRCRTIGREKLYWCLCTRILTEHQMMCVQGLGIHLLFNPETSNDQDDMRKRFLDGLAQQFRLRQIEKKPSLPSS